MSRRAMSLFKPAIYSPDFVSLVTLSSPSAERGINIAALFKIKPSHPLSAEGEERVASVAQRGELTSHA